MGDADERSYALDLVMAMRARILGLMPDDKGRIPLADVIDALDYAAIAITEDDPDEP